MDRSIAWRSALGQALLVAGVAVVLAAVFDDAFFEHWGWLAGPGAWGVCALVVGAWLRLPLGHVLVGAALSGLLLLVLGVLLGGHWLGAPIGLAAFGLWCGGRARSRPAEATA